MKPRPIRAGLFYLWVPAYYLTDINFRDPTKTLPRKEYRRFSGNWY